MQYGKRSERIVSKHAGGRLKMPAGKHAEDIGYAWDYSPQDTETRLNHYLSGPTPESKRTAWFEDPDWELDWPVTPAQRRRLIHKYNRNEGR
jgi:hypothetical protein